MMRRRTKLEQLLKTSVFQAIRWSELTPIFGRKFADTAVILMFMDQQIVARN